LQCIHLYQHNKGVLFRLIFYVFLRRECFYLFFLRFLYRFQLGVPTTAELEAIEKSKEEEIKALSAQKYIEN
ncbi:hypothetical protein, partial [Extibacter muris]|uniref:hypothetical protein n=1 Tax=Extibacter muris TaxID=1796622 RepID=UPI001D083B97